MSLADAQAEDRVHVRADACFAEATIAAICGLDDHAFKLFDRARTWWRTIIDERASSDLRADRDAQRLQRMALIDWLLDGHLDAALVESACDELGRYFGTAAEKLPYARNLPTFATARRYEELMTHFDDCKKLTRPSNINRIQCPGRMSYTLAAFYANDEHDRSSVVQSLEGFLRKHYRACLGVSPWRLGIPHEILQWVHIRYKLTEDSSPICFEPLRDVLK